MLVRFRQLALPLALLISIAAHGVRVFAPVSAEDKSASEHAPLRRLQQELVDEYRATYEALAKTERTSRETLNEARIGYIRAQLDMAADKAERLKLLEQLVDIAKSQYEGAEAVYRAKLGSRQILFNARVDLLRAMIAVEKERERP